jgi:serine O-acetyltransferase
MSHQSLIQQVFDRNSKVFTAFPDKESADEFIAQLFHFLFLPKSGRQQQYTELEKEFESLKSYFSTLIYDVIHDGDQTQQITEQFFSKIPSIYSALLKDAEAIVRFDPAAQSVEEVLVAYPGFFAIAIYRLSHQLSLSGVKIIPRLFTEYAHSKTGIDIHPAARIGESFFIDHGTGIVIGETAVIGSNVKIYQGVTIGALHTTVKDLTA